MDTLVAPRLQHAPLTRPRFIGGRPSKTPDKKALAKDQRKEGHNGFWLNKLGFWFYMTAGLINKVPRLSRSMNNANPSGVFGALANISCYPFLFLYHDINSKLFLQVGNHVAGMARQAKNLNSHISIEDTKAKFAKTNVVMMEATGLPNMREWFEQGLLTRTLGFKLSKEDKRNWKAFGRYLVDDQINGAKNLGLTVKSLGEFLGAVGDKVKNPKQPFKMPESLNVMAKKGKTSEILNANKAAHVNNYVFQHGVIFGAMGTIILEAVMRTLGLHHITKFVTVPVNIALNGAQTALKFTEGQAVWHATNNKGVQPWFYKPIVMGRWVSAVTSGIACVGWNNDIALGLLRLGVVCMTPYDVFHDMFEVKNRMAIRPDKSNVWTKISKGFRVPATLMDAAAAACILSTPFVQHYQKTYDIELNPFAKNSIWSLPKQERTAVWTRIRNQQLHEKNKRGLKHA
jgi:hypothetical protein